MAAKPTITTVTAQADNNAFQVNTATDELADAIATCLERDGTDSMAGNLNMDSNKIINLGEGSADSDAARLIDVSDAVLTSGSVTDKDTVTIVGTDSLLIVDASDSDALKNGLVSDLLARSAHTGTQTVATISDFDVEVANNAAVTANTAKITYPAGDSTKVGYLTVTGAVNLDTINTKVGYLTVTGAVDLDTIDSYVDQDVTSGSSPTLDAANITGSPTLTILTTTTTKATTFDTNVAAAGVTLAGTTLAADGTDTHIDITITPKGNAGIVLPNLGSAPAVTTNKLYQVSGVAYFDGNSLEGGGASASDAAYTRAGWNGDTTDAATKNALSDAFYNMVRYEDADTGGTDCIFVGETGNTTNSGGYCTFCGTACGTANTTGVKNSFYGYGSGFSNTTGSNCSFFGYRSGLLNVGGSRNNAFGDNSLRSLATLGEDNCSFGYNSLYTLDHANADKNCAFGNYSGDAMTEGYENTLSGYNSGGGITTGHHNVCVGSESAVSLTTGDYNVFIGADVDAWDATGDNYLGIGTTSDSARFIEGAMVSGTGWINVRGRPQFTNCIGTSATLSNSSFSIEFTNGTTITFRGKDAGGVERTGTVTLS